MLKIVIITDGPYGNRAFDNIEKKFNTEFIMLEKPISMFMDDIEIPEKDIKLIENANILITYTTHPDLTLELVERFNDKVDWIIVAAWQGEGFKNQLKSHPNVICPYVMCELEENGTPFIDEFASQIGKPQVELRFEENKLKDVKVLRIIPLWVHHIRS